MRRYIYILIVISLLSGCGGTQRYQKPDLSGYVWPPKPYPTKVRLINIVRTDLDIRAKTASETLFGERSSFYFKKPHGIAVDMEGNILVSDSYKNVVHVLNLEKGSIGQLYNPYGWNDLSAVATDNVNGLIGVTSKGTVLIFDQKSKKTIMTLGAAEKLLKPAGIAFDPERKRIYVTDAKKHEIQAYDYNGKHLKLVADDTEVYYPIGIAVHPNGKIYVVDSMNFTVRAYNPDYSYDFSFGAHGDMPGMFARPKGIAIDQDGMIYVTDAAFGNFQIFYPDGRIFGFVGSPGGTFGKFNQPQGIAIDKNDKIYVVDQTNRRLQIFQNLSERYLQAHPDEAAEVKKAWDAMNGRN